MNGWETIEVELWNYQEDLRGVTKFVGEHMVDMKVLANQWGH